MPLVPAICTQCGAKLEVDPNQEAAICPHCHTPFVTETAINNYNTNYVTNIGSLHADVVNLSDDSSRDNRVKAGETYIRLGDYGAAERVFRGLTEECPYDYRGWIGLIKTESQNYCILCDKNSLLHMKELFRKGCAVSSAEAKETYSAQIEAYFSKCEADIKRKAELHKRLANLRMQKANLTASHEQDKDKFSEANNKESNILVVVGIVAAFIISILIAVSDGDGFEMAAFCGSFFIFGGVWAGIAVLIGKSVTRKRRRQREDEKATRYRAYEEQIQRIDNEIEALDKEL